MAFDKKRLETAATAVEEAGKGNKYIMMQDFDHRVVQNHELIATDEVMDALQQSGKKHITMEKPQADQRAVDSYAAGKISREEFVEKVSKTNGWLKGQDSIRDGEAVADIVDKANARGMKVHFVDAAEPETIINDLATGRSKGTTVGDIRQELTKAIEVDTKLIKLNGDNPYTDYKIDLENDKKAKELLDKTGLKDDAPLSELKGKIRTTQETRAEGDKNLAERIVKATNGEPAAIVEGAGHGGSRDGSNGKKDLDEHLAKHGSVGKIGLAGSEKVPAKSGMAEMPNTMIYTDSGFTGKLETKTFDTSRATGAEINVKQTPNFKVGDYKDFKPDTNTSEKNSDRKQGKTAEATAVTTPAGDERAEALKRAKALAENNPEAKKAAEGIQQNQTPGQEVAQGNKPAPVIADNGRGASAGRTA
jgi:hypothetical protein